jgi:hypothetical protein
MSARMAVRHPGNQRAEAYPDERRRALASPPNGQFTPSITKDDRIGGLRLTVGPRRAAWTPISRTAERPQAAA